MIYGVFYFKKWGIKKMAELFEKLKKAKSETEVIKLLESDFSNKGKIFDLFKENERILRKPKVMEMIGVSDPTLWRWERDGEFPKRITLGKNSSGYLESEIKLWMRQKADARGTLDA